MITPLPITTEAHAARRRNVSPERQRVEDALRAAENEPDPLGAAEVAARTGLDLDVVRAHIAACCAKGAAHNTRDRGGRGLYRWGTPYKPMGASTFRVLPPSTPENRYCGQELRPYAGRPGAMHAFTLPSLVNGAPVDRVRPVIISAQPEGKR